MRLLECDTQPPVLAERCHENPFLTPVSSLYQVRRTGIPEDIDFDLPTCATFLGLALKFYDQLAASVNEFFPHPTATFGANHVFTEERKSDR